MFWGYIWRNEILCRKNIRPVQIPANVVALVFAHIHLEKVWILSSTTIITLNCLALVGNQSKWRKTMKTRGELFEDIMHQLSPISSLGKCSRFYNSTHNSTNIIQPKVNMVLLFSSKNWIVSKRWENPYIWYIVKYIDWFCILQLINPLQI